MSLHPGKLGGTSWTPASIPSLVAWWDASHAADLTLASGKVASWASRAGSVGSPLAQATGGSQPAYSATGLDGTRAGVTFDGSSSYLYVDTALIWPNGGAAILCVLKAPNQQFNGFVADCSNVSDEPLIFPMRATANVSAEIGAYYRDDSGSAFLHSAGSPVDLGEALLDNAKHVYALIDSGSAVTPYLDGSAGSAVSYSRAGITATVTRFSVGAVARPSVANFASMTLAELVVAPVSLSGADRAAYFSYAKAKWGTP